MQTSDISSCVRKFFIPTFLLVSLLLPMEGRGETWVVKADGTGDAPTIQAAIDSTISDDLILVEPGIYFENLNTRGKTFTLQSTDGPRFTVVDGSEGATTVIISDLFESPDTVIEGFTLQNGIGVPLSSPHSTQLRFGGAVAILSARPTYRNCIFRNNTANIGGAVYALDCRSLFEDVIIDGNIAGDGAAIAFENCQGIRFDDVAVTNNEGVFGGGFTAGVGSVGHFTRCRFEDNRGTEGGLFRVRSSDIEMRECVVVGNQAGEGSVGIVEFGGVRILQSTVVANGGELDDPFLVGLVNESSLIIDHSIVAFNEVSSLVSCNGGTAEMTCSDIFPPFGMSPPCLTGSSNIQLDPLFCDLTMVDLMLHPDSPCTEENSPPDCGLIGALPVGCGTSGLPSGSSTETTTWGQVKARYSGR